MARNYLDGKKKAAITFLAIVIVIGGLVTLHSQIHYGSPIGFLNNNSLPNIQPKSEPAPVVSYRTALVNSNGLNLRPAPSVNNEPIKILRQGTQVKVLSVDNQGWAKVIDDEGAEGYLFNDYLRY